MAHPHEQLVRDGYAAFARGDIDALQRQFFAEDIRWHYPGRSPFGGDYAGLAQVIGWLGRTFEATGGTIHIELHDVVAGDDHVAALTRIRAERPGRQYADNTVQVFHIQDGKATEVWTYPADLYAADEFWS
jgi:ketosteroid isomerase-like protein